MVEKSWDDSGFSKSSTVFSAGTAGPASLPRFQKEISKATISNAIALPAHCAESYTRAEQQRPAETTAFLGRHIPSSKNGPWLDLLYDMAPCRTPRTSKAGDKVRLLEGWRVKARSCSLSFPPGPSRRPKRDIVIEKGRTLSHFGCANRRILGTAHGPSDAPSQCTERGRQSTSSLSFFRTIPEGLEKWP